ncbi:MAG TPA: NAD(P)-binding protein [Phormidium sp.]
MSEATETKKIVLLGGGMASLTTAFELTNQPGWNANYDITIYQTGWRLGGKGASGRNVRPHEPYCEPNYRIEEHGLHIFFGFYQNAFQVMKQCYDELGYDGPFTSVEDAFKPHSLIVLQEYLNGKWVQWPLNFPTNKLLPWEAGGIATLWEHIWTTLKLMHESYEDLTVLNSSLSVDSVSNLQTTPTWLERLIKQIDLGLETLKLTSETALFHFPDKLVQLLLHSPERWWEWFENTTKEIGTILEKTELTSEGTFLYLAYKLAESLSNNPRSHRIEHHRIIKKLIERFMERFQLKIDQAIELDANTFLLVTLLDLGAANIRGLIADEIVFHGSLDPLDEFDYRDWLRKHGARETTLNSAFVRVLYDLVYAFPGGNIQQPELAAGTAIRILTTVIFQYKGAIMWKMQAGMGDTIFAPLYKVLKRRGVKFKFFHRVKQLHLSEDGKSIERISIGRQVNLIDKNQEYDPLIQVKRLLCWPSEPRYEQIEEGEKLQQENINLESFWSPWTDVEEVNLKAGEDFDIAVLGISLGGLPAICSELIQANQKWRDMISKIQTVATQGGQIWLKDNLRQLGWKIASPVVGAYVEPLDTYADMSVLLERENWPSEHYPYNVAYFTGVIADPGIPPSHEYDFPEKVQKQVDKQAINFLQNHIGHLWPKATTAENPQGLNWDLLVDLENRQGEERYHAQYWQAGINPSDRYVLSVPGSTKYRLKTDESGFDHLYLTGDWINNGYNSGCIEATVMSGMQTAQAILKQRFQTKYQKEILNERDSWT